MDTTFKLHSLTFDNVRTYAAACLFVLGNVMLPQLVHFVPQGGPTWLPIYFFTLVGAYVFGWRVGLLTALASPLVNSVLFGMPSVAALPVITLKSVLLAVAAGLTARRFKCVTMLLIFAVVFFYQFFGGLGEWIITGDLSMACQDFRIGVPGMLVQVIGGYIVIRLLDHMLVKG